MNKCVFYLRDQAGKIQPIESLGEVPRDGLLGLYPFEEPLMNFPETDRVLVDEIWPMRRCGTRKKFVTWLPHN